MIVNKYYYKNSGVRQKFVRFMPVKLVRWAREKRDGYIYKKKFKARYDNSELYTLPDTIQIETVNRCNGECSFCPVNKNVDTREMKIMSDELFEKIVNELSSINYSGKIALFSNNEPFIDAKIYERAKLIKTTCSEAYIYIYTNGSLLDNEKFNRIEPWLDKIIIDNYNDNLTINENLLPIVKLCENDQKLNEKTEIHLRKVNEILYSRGGQAPNKKITSLRKYPCFLPFNQMVIRPDGKVSLCCSDALGKMTLGNISEDTIVNIWYSDTYKNIRERIINNIDSISLCKFCDAKYLG